MVPAGELCGAEGPGPVQHVHGREGDRQRQDQVGQGCTVYRAEGFFEHFKAISKLNTFTQVKCKQSLIPVFLTKRRKYTSRISV